jgi:hypothetical protein
MRLNSPHPQLLPEKTWGERASGTHSRLYRQTATLPQSFLGEGGPVVPARVGAAVVPAIAATLFAQMQVKPRSWTRQRP